MRYLSIFVFAFSLVPSFAIAGEPLTPRPLDPVAIDAFARAQAQSALVRSLVATLESSNVIVHIVSSRSLPAGIGGTTRFVTSRGGYRYVRITSPSTSRRPAERPSSATSCSTRAKWPRRRPTTSESVEQLFETDRSPRRRVLRNPGGDRCRTPDPERARAPIAGSPSTALGHERYRPSQ